MKHLQFDMEELMHGIKILWGGTPLIHDDFR
jgi:hypothetical protein